jgi:hypothetical protein
MAPDHEPDKAFHDANATTRPGDLADLAIRSVVNDMVRATDGADGFTRHPMYECDPWPQERPRPLPAPARRAGGPQRRRPGGARRRLRRPT